MDSPRVVVINSEMARLHGDKIREMLCDYAEVIVSDVWLDELELPKPEGSEIKYMPRRNKSDRKRNRANRWR